MTKLPKRKFVKRVLQNAKVITYCDFSEPGRRTEIGRHLTYKTAINQYARLWNTYARIRKHKVWQEEAVVEQPIHRKVLGKCCVIQGEQAELMPFPYYEVEKTPTSRWKFILREQDKSTLPFKGVFSLKDAIRRIAELRQANQRVYVPEELTTIRELGHSKV
jgi:hypothetical protein